MKLPKLNTTSLDAIGILCQYGKELHFEDNLYQAWFRKALESLILKVARAKFRLRNSTGLSLTESEALALREAGNFALNSGQFIVEYHIMANHLIYGNERKVLQR